MRFAKELSIGIIDVKCEVEGPVRERPIPRISVYVYVRQRDNVTRELFPPITCVLSYKEINMTEQYLLLGEGVGLPKRESGLFEVRVPGEYGDPLTFIVEPKRELIEELDEKLSTLPATFPLKLGVSITAHLLDNVRTGAQESRGFNAHVRDIEVPREEWNRWMERWGKNIKMITMRGNLTKRFDGLKSKWNLRDDFDLLDSMLDRCEGLKRPEVEHDLICTLPPKTEIRSKVEEMLGKAQESVLITSPYFDGSMVGQIDRLVKKGVKVSLVTRPKKSQNKANEQALDLVEKMGVKVKFDNMIHGRLLVVDEREALVSSADLTSDSLDSNLEVAIHTASPTVVRKAIEFFESSLKS